jgi:hypothetical protein
VLTGLIGSLAAVLLIFVGREISIPHIHAQSESDAEQRELHI